MKWLSLSFISSLLILFVFGSGSASASVAPTALGAPAAPGPVAAPAPAASTASAAAPTAAPAASAPLTAPAAQAAANPTASQQDSCEHVCADIKTRLSAHSKRVAAEAELWSQRLGLKGDIVLYPKGFSASEELLRFMSTYYVTRAPENQMDPQFLAYLMGKCFPETYVDADRARMSGLVNTIWAAKSLRIEKEISTCK